MRRVPTRLEVYWPDTDYRAAPDDVVSFGQGAWWARNGFADFVKHGKAIRMRRAWVLAGSPVPLRAQSLECRRDKIETIDYRGKWMSRGAQAT